MPLEKKAKIEPACIHRREWLRRSRAVAVTAATAMVTGCTPSQILNAFVPDTGYRFVADQRFREGKRGLLDLYLPDAGATPVPTIVFIYGGDWRDGNKGMYRFVGQAFASRGFAVAIPDYRLFPEFDSRASSKTMRQHLRGPPDMQTRSGSTGGVSISWVIPPAHTMRRCSRSMAAGSGRSESIRGATWAALSGSPDLMISYRSMMILVLSSAPCPIYARPSRSPSSAAARPRYCSRPDSTIRPSAPVTRCGWPKRFARIKVAWR